MEKLKVTKTVFLFLLAFCAAWRLVGLIVEVIAGLNGSPDLFEVAHGWCCHFIYRTFGLNPLLICGVIMGCAVAVLALRELFQVIADAIKSMASAFKKRKDA